MLTESSRGTNGAQRHRIEAISLRICTFYTNIEISLYSGVTRTHKESTPWRPTHRRSHALQLPFVVTILCPHHHPCLTITGDGQKHWSWVFNFWDPHCSGSYYVGSKSDGVHVDFKDLHVISSLLGARNAQNKQKGHGSCYPKITNNK